MASAEQHEEASSSASDDSFDGESIEKVRVLARYKLDHPDWFHTLPQEPSLGDWLLYLPRASLAYYRRLVGCFGWRFVWMLFSGYFGIKGILFGMLSIGMLPYFKLYIHVSGRAYQMYSIVSFTPWAMKALFGSISDAFPIYGRHKTPYIIGSGMLGLIAFTCLAGFDLDESSAVFAAVLFFLGHVFLVVVDLLLEGKYAELMVEQPHTSTDLVTWVWGCTFAGFGVSSAVVGPLADSGYIHQMFWACLPIAAQILLPACLLWLPEAHIPDKSSYCCSPSWDKVWQHWRTFLMAVVMAVFAIILAVFNVVFQERPIWILVYCVSAGGLLCWLSYWALPRKLASCNVYMFLAAANYLSIQGAVDYYYTASAECAADAPHFDFTFYSTYSSLVQSVFGALGVAIFHGVMGDWQFRSVFWSTALLRSAAGFVDIVIVNRWNTAFGISDHVMYMLGYNIVFEVSAMLSFMPAVILTSKLCPKGMESTMYALLAGFSNFGRGIASSLGIFLIEDVFNIRTPAKPTTEDPCDFGNLGWLIFFSHMLLPLSTIPLTFCLIPRASLSDDLRPTMDVEQKTDSASESEAEQAQPESEAEMVVVGGRKRGELALE